MLNLVKFSESMVQIVNRGEERHADDSKEQLFGFVENALKIERWKNLPVPTCQRLTKLNREAMEVEK